MRLREFEVRFAQPTSSQGAQVEVRSPMGDTQARLRLVDAERDAILAWIVPALGARTRGARPAPRAGSVPLPLPGTLASGWQRQRWAHWRVTGPPGGLPPGHAGAYLAVSVPAARARLAPRVRLRGQVGTWLFGRCFSGCLAGPDEAAVELLLEADAPPPGDARAVSRRPGAAAGARGSRPGRERR